MFQDQKLVQKITVSIDRAMIFLGKEQQKDGSFLSLSSPSRDHFDQSLKFHSTFSTALVLSCLNSLEETVQLAAIKKRCVSFLLSQKSKDWSFNYWKKGSKENKTMPYPDDLDDTFCALSALFEYDPEIIDGRALAKVAHLLTAQEEKVGGPYRTWLAVKNAVGWEDVDLVVNSNVAYFLLLEGINLPNLNKFIISKIKQKKMESKYYPSVYPIVYFISRFFQKKEKYQTALSQMLLDIQIDEKSDNPLHVALATSSMLLLGTSSPKIRQAVIYLLSQQNSKGNWQAYSFCFDPIINGKVHYSGSSPLTTAFCLEALQRYLTTTNNKPKILQNDEAEIIYREIVSNIKKRISSLQTELNSKTLECLGTTLQKENKKQVALFPYYFKLALGNRAVKLTNQFIVELGTANLYGWIAYTIYDDFLDDEGDPKKLSVANLALRELTTIFTGILPRTDFAQVFKRIMDQLENANTWEVTHCRAKILDSMIKLENFIIPDYGDLSKLAERSLGHALTPIAILYSLGFDKKSIEAVSSFQFFKHYLIARQLNDDAHDWEKDLKMGHINAVGSILLKKYRIKTNIKMSILIPKLQEIFWYEAIVEVSNLVLEHTRIARRHLKQCSVIHQSLADKLLEKYEKSAKLALREQKNATKFLASY